MWPYLKVVFHFAQSWFADRSSFRIKVIRLSDSFFGVESDSKTRIRCIGLIAIRTSNRIRLPLLLTNIEDEYWYVSLLNIYIVMQEHLIYITHLKYLYLSELQCFSYRVESENIKCRLVGEMWDWNTMDFLVKSRYVLYVFHSWFKMNLNEAVSPLVASFSNYATSRNLVMKSYS